MLETVYARPRHRVVKPSSTDLEEERQDLFESVVRNEGVAQQPDFEEEGRALALRRHHWRRR